MVVFDDVVVNAVACDDDVVLDCVVVTFDLLITVGGGTLEYLPTTN